jgi:hypothetical protein
MTPQGKRWRLGAAFVDAVVDAAPALYDAVCFTSP